MKRLKSACLSLAFGMAATGLTAQENPDGPLKLSLQTKNAHIWRGLEVSDHSLIDGDLRLSTKDNALSVGVFGLTSFSRDYKEFDYYLGTSKNSVFRASDKKSFKFFTRLFYSLKSCCS